MQKLYQKTYKKTSITKNIGIFIGVCFTIILVLARIYFSGRVDIWGYEKDLEQRIPFVKEELIVYGRYDKNVISFDTNYGNKLIYTFPENTPIENIAKFTKENVGQIAEIRVNNIQDAFTKVFNIKVQ